MSNTQRQTLFDLDDLRQLAHDHPLVNAALVAYDYNNVPLEQVLLGLIVALCEQIRTAEDALNKIAREGPPPIVLNILAERADALLEMWKQSSTYRLVNR